MRSHDLKSTIELLCFHEGITLATLIDKLLAWTAPTHIRNEGSEVEKRFWRVSFKPIRGASPDTTPAPCPLCRWKNPPVDAIDSREGVMLVYECDGPPGGWCWPGEAPHPPLTYVRRRADDDD
jgi:hypothetical protein